MGEWGGRKGAALGRGRWGRCVVALAVGTVALSIGSAAAFPGANGGIAFSRNGDIWTMDASGGSQLQLTTGGANDTDPFFSADGTIITFGRDGKVVGVPAAGGAVDLIVDNASDPSASPDGTIAFIRGGAVWIDNGGETNLTGGSGLTDASGPAYSPNGALIAFSARSAGNVDIYVIPAGGGAPVRRTESNGDDIAPSWSPDGARIAFVSKRDNSQGELYLMNADGSGQIGLTSNSVTDASPAWAPSGALLVFSREGDIYTMPPIQGAPATQLTPGGANDVQPDWGTNQAMPRAVSLPVIWCEDLQPCEADYRIPDGETLGATSGVWSPPVPPGAFQWLRCDINGANCQPIAGATGATYTTATADIGSRIRVRETVTGGFGSASADSAPTADVIASAPRNQEEPTIESDDFDVEDEEAPPVGALLEATTGTWRGTSPIIFNFTWKRCDEGPANCANAGTGSTYKVQQGDVGKVIVVDVQATNSVGSATASSEPTAPVVSAAPINVDAPTIPSTTIRVGTAVTSTNGVWNGLAPITFTYQWQRCTALKTGCTDIAGARLSSYTPVATDSNLWLAIKVTARNSAGSATATGFSTVAVAASAPLNTIKPVITGTPRVGSPLTVSTGTWTGQTPITYTYQWVTCDEDDDCEDITGATSSTYTPVDADLDHTLYVEVTATNVGGKTTVDTNETTAVAARLPGGTATRPANTALPRITGTPRNGQSLVASAGSWSGTAPLTFAYVWQRCDAAAANCVAIAGQTAATFKLTAADLGKRIKIVVSARNSAGTATATSLPTAVVTTGAVAGARRIVGTAKANVLRGGAGNDTIFGRAGNDTLFGLAGNDTLLGEAGNDKLYGSTGNDVLNGGIGNDALYPAAGKDTAIGGLGNDLVSAVDGVRDVVDCGKGSDRALVDAIDVVRNCEKVTRAKPKSSGKLQRQTRKTSVHARLP